ncbi:MAG: hypothetical protein H6581_21425 [Bacteroidia bacterium]|nr:hypothetical protein [Bacteroidia bacterium]
MIRINKSSANPEILKGAGKKALENLKDQYDLNPESYKKPYHKETNPNRLNFDPGIYGAQEVKEQLKADQFNKCVYCEAIFSHTSPGDVEHFRPKAAVKQGAKGRLEYPGYYWLAYDWDNLFYSCEICNRSWKKNIFPLKEGVERVRDHRSATCEAVEDTLLIHPTLENPEDHITFEGHIPKPRDGSEKGRKSISVLGLKRKDLNDARRECLQNVQLGKILASYIEKTPFSTLSTNEKIELKKAINQQGISDIELEEILVQTLQVAKNGAKSNHPFAGMIRANFPDLPTNAL